MDKLKDALTGRLLRPGDAAFEEARPIWNSRLAKTPAAVAQFSSGGVYVNLLGEDEGDRIREAYGKNYERLVGLKKLWDPENRFQKNQNIRPH